MAQWFQRRANNACQLVGKREDPDLSSHSPFAMIFLSYLECNKKYVGITPVPLPEQFPQPFKVYTARKPIILAKM